MEPKLRPLPETPTESRDTSPDLVLARMHIAEGNHAAAKPLLQAHINAHPDDKEAFRQLLSLSKTGTKQEREVTLPMMIVSFLWETLKAVVS